MKQIPNELFFSWVESEIAEGRSVRFRLKGHSMYPLLRNGRDEILLYPCSAGELKPMDLILFKYNGKHLLHRIIKIEGSRLYIQGDGSIKAKEQCTAADVVGKVKAIIRPSGKTISVDDWRWTLPSNIWQRVGFLRGLILRIHYHLTK